MLRRTITVVLALVATGANAEPPDIQTILDERVEAGLTPGIVVGVLHDDGSTEFISAGTLQAGGRGRTGDSAKAVLGTRMLRRTITVV
ncbi:MAG: hypothetical protein QF723_06895, partial [Phycisphaerales bacterium]|nr:hypothetical protein [Phycisphaerales bacterium]